MTELLLKQKEFINLFLGFIISFIPIVFDIKNDRKLNRKGWVLIFICILFITFSSFVIYQENRKLSPDDIKLEFNLRSPTPMASYQDISEKLPKEIFSPHIEIEKIQTSGTFKLQNIYSGKGRVLDSKFATYVCNVSGNKSIQNFPLYVEDVKPENVIVYLSFKEITKLGYTLDGSIKLLVRNKEYWGNLDIENGIVVFPKQTTEK